MKYFLKIFKESIIVVIISSIFGLVTGSVLAFNDKVFYAIPVILLILPSLNSLIGNISIVLISRLTTQLFIGSLKPKIQISDKLKKDFIALFITVCLSFLFLIIMGYSIAFITPQIKIVNPIIISFIIIMTILILFISLFILLFICTVLLFKQGKDPNNFLIPFTTSLADFLTPVILIIFIQIFI